MSLTLIINKKNTYYTIEVPCFSEFSPYMPDFGHLSGVLLIDPALTEGKTEEAIIRL